jgi:hypothetical protein
LGAASAALFVITTAELAMLTAHLREHGVKLTDALSVLAESRHPSQIQVLFVCSLLCLIPLSTLVALQCAIVAIGSARKKNRNLSRKQPPDANQRIGSA